MTTRKNGPSYPKSSSGGRPRRVSDVDRVIGRNVRELRLGAGLSLEDVGNCLGISYQQVQKYETGGNRLPLHHIPLLCDLFNVPVMVFLSGVMSEPQEDGGRGDDLVRVQFYMSRISDRVLRQKVLDVVDILSL